MKTKQELILENIAASKELQKNISKIRHFTNEDFYRDALRYIKAIKEGRMFAVITSVSASGISRNIKYIECEKGEKRYCFNNFNTLFVALGFKKSRSNSDFFLIRGCGMDMNIYTNYQIIQRFHRLGFLTKKQCDILCQEKPNLV